MVVTAGPSPRKVAIQGILILIAFVGIDQIATRPVHIEVEQYRETGLTDEEVLVEALEVGLATAQHTWWIRGRRTRLVFAENRTYELSTALSHMLDLQQAMDRKGRLVAEISLN